MIGVQMGHLPDFEHVTLQPYAQLDGDPYLFNGYDPVMRLEEGGYQGLYDAGTHGTKIIPPNMMINKGEYDRTFNPFANTKIPILIPSNDTSQR